MRRLCLQFSGIEHIWKFRTQSLKGMPGAVAALEAIGIDPQRRAETVTVGEFVTLARALTAEG